MNRHQLVGYYPSFFLGRVPQEEWQQQHRTVVSNDLNPPEMNSPEVISRTFPSKFLHTIYITSVSGNCTHLIFKICQIVAGTSMTSQFHEIF